MCHIVSDLCIHCLKNHKAVNPIMNAKLKRWQLVGFFVVSLGGTLLHFLYDWTESPFAALISGVNESTWEHMKLLFFPMFLFAILESFFVSKGQADFWCVKLGGTLLGLTLIPTLFYTLRGVFGSTPDFVNIGIFFFSAALAYLWECKRFREGGAPCCKTVRAMAALCVLAVLFFVFTFYPPALPLFQDPLNGTYGPA